MMEMPNGERTVLERVKQWTTLSAALIVLPARYRKGKDILKMLTIDPSYF